MTRAARTLALCSVVAAAYGCSDEAAKLRHFENGKRLLDAGQSRQAVIELKNAVARDEKWGDARLLLGDAYVATAQPEAAYREYLRAADLLPNDARAQLKAATYLVRARQFDDAIERARRVLALEPGNVDAQVVLANGMAGVHNVDEALTLINNAIAADPSRSQTYASLAHVHLVQGRTQEALEAYATAVKIDPKSIGAHLALAVFQWSLGDRAAAEQTLKLAHAIDPSHVGINRALATIYLGARHPRDAERHLELAARASGSDEDRMRLADFYISQRQFAEARQVLSSSAQPNVGAIETRLARIDYLEGRIEAANDRVHRVLAREPNYGAMLVLKAQQSLRDARWEDAIWEADAVLDAQPRSTAAHYIRAEAEVQRGHAEAALQSYSQVLRLDSKAVNAMVALSRLNLARNVVESAVLYAHEALSLAPNHLGARLALIRGFLARGDDGLAASELMKLPADARHAPEAFVLQGMLQWKKGQISAARIAFENALKLDPAAREPLQLLTSIDVRQRDTTKAAQRIEAALAVRSDDPDLLVLSARVAIARNDRRAAEATLRRAIDRDPLNVSAVALLVQIFTQEQRLSAAVEEFDGRAAQAPADVGARLVAAVAIHTSGKIAEAERRYRDVLRLQPRAVLAANNLAAIYLDRGENLDEAERFAATAAEYAPDNAEVLDTLASIYSVRQMYGRAIKLHEQAIALQPSNAIFHYHLGVTCARNADTTRARQEFGTAVRLDSSLSAAQRALDALR